MLSCLLSRVSVFCLLSSAVVLRLSAAVATNAPPTVATPSVTNAPPAAIAPVWREFSVKCADGIVKRTDLIVFKRFIASSALDGAAKKEWTARARQLYQQALKGPRRQP